MQSVKNVLKKINDQYDISITTLHCYYDATTTFLTGFSLEPEPESPHEMRSLAEPPRTIRNASIPSTTRSPTYASSEMNANAC